MSQNARRIIAEWDNERMVKGFQEAIEYALKGDIPLASQAELSGMLMVRSGEQDGRVDHCYWAFTVMMLDEPTLPAVS
jgi:hypothetical protein